MSTKLIRNRLAIKLASLFILIFLLPTIASDQQASPSFQKSIIKDQSNDQLGGLEKQSDSRLNDSLDKQNDKQSVVKIRKQRNSFTRKELSNHFHNKYYSSVPIVSNYRSSDSIYLNEQSDAYVPYRSNHSLLTSTDSLGAFLSASSLISSANLLQSSSTRVNKLSHHAIQGPLFQQDLPAKVSFSNNSGLILNCVANGHPTPVISWQTETGISVLSPSQSIDSLNLLSESSKYLPLVHQNPTTNALVFRSFASDEFSPEVHSTKYRCLATNQHGTITSPLVQVKAVIKQLFQIEVPDEYVTLRSTAVFRCQMPNQLKDQLQVISWIEEPGSRSYPVASHSYSQYSSFTIPSSHLESLINGSQYLTMPTGELYINQVDFTTSKKRFRCKVKNKLTGETSTSVTAGKLIITEAHTASQLRITDYRDKVNARLSYQSLNEELDRTRSQNDLHKTDKADEYAMLVCNAQSQPLPTYTWYRVQSNGQRTPVSSILDLNSDHKGRQYGKQSTFNNSIDNSLQKQTDFFSLNLEQTTNRAQIQSFKYIQWAGVLFIRHFNLRDDGLYTCVVNNTFDEERLDTRLSIQVPLSIKLTPTRENIESGRQTQFNCTVIGHPQPEITFWFNGKRKQPNQSAQLLSKYSAFQLPSETAVSGVSTSTTNSLYWSEQLQLTKASKDNKGMAQCFAANEFEQVQATAQLSLGTDPPVFHELFQSQILDPGPSLSIKCSASGTPIPQITWSLDDAALPESNRVRYGDYVTKDSITISYVNISELRVEDGGIYRCTADNNFAKVQYERSIQIRGDPIVRPMPNITVIQGETFVKHCPVSGHPIDEIVWYQGDTKLAFNHRQKVSNNGTLEVQQVEKGTDESAYTCQALARGKKSQSTFYVSVIVKPTIESFEFPKHLREGQRASVTCTVSSGDLPICLNWYHQGEPIEKLNKTVLTKSISAYSSTLLFESLSLIHSGNYTCTAQNDAGEVSHSAIMQVNVAPRWLVEPSSEYSVVRGKSISIDCQSIGFPLPYHRWTKQDKTEGNSPKDFKPIVSNPHLQVYENGSLTFVDARDVDKGYYLCSASNNIGTGLSKVVKINVNVAAHFKSKFSVETKQKGEHVRLKCESQGDKPLKISWFKDKQRIEMKSIEILNDQSLQSLHSIHSEPALLDSSRYEITDKLTTNGLISYLDIAKSERKDSGLFSCFAYNQHGHDDTNTQLIIQEKPDPPNDIQVVDVQPRSIKLSCQAPFNGNLPITSYLVHYSDDQSNLQQFDQLKIAKVHNLTIKSGECVAHLTQLKPARTYYIRLIAENRLGPSDVSPIVDVTTDEDLPSAPPTKLKSVVLSSKQVKVSWRPPDESSVNGRLKGYYVGFRLLNGNNNKEQFVYKTIEFDNGKYSAEQVSSTILGNLRKNSKYALIVQVFNNKGTGPSSEELVVQTAELDPPESPQLHVTSSSTTSIHLNWQPSQLDENPIDGYLLFQREENTLEWKEYSLDAQQTFYTTLGLKCGTRYQFYLIAYNKQGRGEPSETTTVKTDGGLPVAPDKKSALSVNTSSVMVKLDAWHSGGCAIIGFRIRYKLHGAKEWTQVNADQTAHHRNTNSQIDGQSMINDLNSSNAQQLSSTNLMSNSISQLGNGFYSMSRQQEINSNIGIPSAININDLQPGRKYLIQISAINQVGSTDAEYNVNTYSMISNELMRSSNRLLQHGQQLSAQLADYTYLLPVCLSLMIITVLLLMVCVIVKRNNQIPNASTSLLYGSIMGNRKEEQLQMANFSTLSANKAKQMSCDGSLNCDTMGHLLITANGTICETMPKLNNGQLESNGHHTGLEPLYAATVKRTPRSVRNAADPHIYSYPVQMTNGGGNLTAMNTLNNTLNNLNNLNNLNSMGSMGNGLACNQYTNNTYASNPCNGTQCSDAMNCAMNNCNQMKMDTCPMMNQCGLENETSNKLMNCSNGEYIQNSSSCNTSINSSQLMNTTGNMANNLSNKIMCAEHEMTMDSKFPIELGGLCHQMMR